LIVQVVGDVELAGVPPPGLEPDPGVAGGVVGGAGGAEDAGAWAVADAAVTWIVNIDLATE
jgi:hypothetical protein